VKKHKKEAILKRPPSTSAENSAVPLEPFPDSGKPKPRVKDMKSLHGIYVQSRIDDEKSAYNRGLVRDAADGAPPYEYSSIEQDGRFNLNFHDLSGLLDERNATYTDLIDSVPNIARFFYPETVDDSAGSEYAEKADIIAEEHTQLIRHDWEDFFPQWDILTNEKVQHGVSLAFYPDETTWKWKAAGLDEFLVPRQTKASEAAVDVLFIRDKMNIDVFYRYIADEKTAKAVGWNIPESRRALVKATKDGSSRVSNWRQYWNQIQDEIANNDLGHAYGTAQQVDVIHGLVKETGDGSFSHYIFLEDGSGEDFLFQRRSRYADGTKVFTLFTARIGRNGKLHSVRGDLWRAYPEAQAINRLRCAALDSTAHSMAILLQPADAESMEDFALVLNGPVAWLPPEANVIQQRATPNLAQNALPMIQDLTSTMRENLGLSRPDSYDPANTQRGQQFQQLSLGSLTGAQVTRFYRSWGRTLTSQWERIVAIGPNNSRYPEIQRFYERLFMRGVTPEEVAAVDRIEPYRAAGNGSVGHRMQAYDMGMQTIQMLDEVGRARFLRDKYAEQFGRDIAAQYVGRPQKPRFVIDARLAELENSALKDNPELVPMPGENDLVHAQVHLGKAGETVQRVMEMLTQKGQVDPAPAIPELQYVEILLGHTQPHLAAISEDPTRRQAFSELQKAFQQIGARFKSMSELAQRLTPTEQVQQEHLSAMQMKMQEHQLNMQIVAENHQQQVQLRAADLQHKIAARKAQTDAKVATTLTAAIASK
jgi:hypothetical protein